MLKISIIDTESERRLVVEGKLIEPWVAELKNAWKDAITDLQERKLVIDLSNATVISREGEEAIFQLMSEGAKFACCGVLTKYVLKRLAHRCHGSPRKLPQEQSTS